MEETAIMDEAPKHSDSIVSDDAADGAEVSPPDGDESLFSGPPPYLGPPRHAGPRSREDELGDLVAAARQGDQSVLPQLRAALDDNPDLWRHAADLGAHAEHAWIELIAGSDAYVGESLHRRVAEMKQELAGTATPTALEKLLIQRITVGWLITNFADLSYVQGKNQPLALAKYALDRQDRSQRRFLAAIAGLQSMRKVLGRGATAAGSNLQPDGAEAPEAADTVTQGCGVGTEENASTGAHDEVDLEQQLVPMYRGNDITEPTDGVSRAIRHRKPTTAKSSRKRSG
jgi:hypothetical protein